MVVNDAAMRDYNALLECMKNQGGSYDIPLIEKAFNYCVDHHLGQSDLPMRNIIFTLIMLQK